MPILCIFHPIWVCVWGGGGLPRGLGHNLLMHFSSLGSSRMVIPLPSLRCLAEGNRILIAVSQIFMNCALLHPVFLAPLHTLSILVLHLHSLIFCLNISWSFCMCLRLNQV